jgi:hypothetical protein
MFAAADARGQSWPPTDKAVAPVRELLCRRFEAQL